MTTINMGYIGAGFLAQKVHIPNIVSLDHCKLLALAEVRPLLAQRVCDRFRIERLYEDHHALAKDPDIHAVAVSGHFAGQADIAIDLLRAGKDVFMEKPMALSVAHAEDVLNAERESGRRLMVAYMKRYDGGNVRAKQIIDELRESGELGRITYVRNHGFCGDWIAGSDVRVEGTDEAKPHPPPLTDYLPEWLPADQHQSYLGYLQQYTHNINLVRWLLDAEDDAVVKAVDLDDGYSGIVIFDLAGVRTVIESGNVTYPGWEEHTQVYFEQGWVKMSSPPLLLPNTPVSVEIYRNHKGDFTRSELFPKSGWTWSYKEEMRHFIDCLSSGAPLRSPASDTMTDVRLMEEIYRKYLANGE